MKAKFIPFVSLIALAGALPAISYAQDASSAPPATTTTNDSSSSTMSQDVKKGWDNTKKAVSNAANSASNATNKAYQNVKAALITDRSDGKFDTITINGNTTANGMIGKPIYNARNEKVATVKDIILDQDGKATHVIVSEGGFMGVGQKYAAFDYSLVSQRQQNGDVIMPLSDETIKKAAQFSYDRKDADKAGVTVIPEGGVSVKSVLGGQMVNQKDETVAQVDNISFRDGAADQVIVAFDQTLGMGGRKAAVAYKDVKLVRQDKNGKNLDFQLSANEAAQFDAFKKTAND